MKTRGHLSRIRTSASRTRNDVEGAALLQLHRVLRDACVASQQHIASPSKDCSLRGPWPEFYECRAMHNRVSADKEYAARTADTASPTRWKQIPWEYHKYYVVYSIPRSSATPTVPALPAGRTLNSFVLARCDTSSCNSESPAVAETHSYQRWPTSYLQVHRSSCIIMKPPAVVEIVSYLLARIIRGFRQKQHVDSCYHNVAPPSNRSALSEVRCVRDKWSALGTGRR